VRELAFHVGRFQAWWEGSKAGGRSSLLADRMQRTECQMKLVTFHDPSHVSRRAFVALASGTTATKTLSEYEGRKTQYSYTSNGASRHRWRASKNH
jgi:hypothetical protein